MRITPNLQNLDLQMNISYYHIFILSANVEKLKSYSTSKL